MNFILIFLIIILVLSLGIGILVTVLDKKSQNKDVEEQGGDDSQTKELLETQNLAREFVTAIQKEELIEEEEPYEVQKFTAKVNKATEKIQDKELQNKQDNLDDEII